MRIHTRTDAAADGPNVVVASLAEGWRTLTGVLLAALSVWPFVVVLMGVAYLLRGRWWRRGAGAA